MGNFIQQRAAFRRKAAVLGWLGWGGVVALFVGTVWVLIFSAQESARIEAAQKASPGEEKKLFFDMITYREPVRIPPQTPPLSPIFLMLCGFVGGLTLVFRRPLLKLLTPELFCPSCQQHVDKEAGWRCPFCQQVNGALLLMSPHSILDACWKCKREPPAYECPACGTPILLSAGGKANLRAVKATDEEFARAGIGGLMEGAILFGRAARHNFDAQAMAIDDAKKEAELAKAKAEAKKYEDACKQEYERRLAELPGILRAVRTAAEARIQLTKTQKELEALINQDSHLTKKQKQVLKEDLADQVAKFRAEIG